MLACTRRKWEQELGSEGEENVFLNQFKSDVLKQVPIYFSCLGE